MTKREKRLQRIRQNPKNVSFEDLRQVLEDHQFVLERSAGSHFQFYAEVGGKLYRLSVPFKRPFIMAVYVKRALQVIDEIAANIEAEDSDDDD